MDRKMMNGGNIQPLNNKPAFPILPPKPYQNTDGIIQQIQSIIQ